MVKVAHYFRTYQNISLFSLGMWSAAFYLGNFIGPTVSGFLVEILGFEFTSMMLFGVYIVIWILDVLEPFL